MISLSVFVVTIFYIISLQREKGFLPFLDYWIFFVCVGINFDETIDTSRLLHIDALSVFFFFLRLNALLKMECLASWSQQRSQFTTQIHKM